MWGKKFNEYVITFQQTGFDTFLHISGSFASAHLVFFLLCLVVVGFDIEFPDFQTKNQLNGRFGALIEKYHVYSGLYR